MRACWFLPGLHPPIMKAEAGFLGSWYFQVQAWINSSRCASAVGERQQSAVLNSGGRRKSLPKHRSYHCFSPTHTVPPKKRYVLSSGIRTWLWSSPSSWGLLTASVWQSSPPLTEISSLLPHYFGSDCRERNSFWQIHSWNELSLAAGGSLLRLPSCSLS